MIIAVILGVLAASGVVWLLISNERNRFTDTLKSTRSPRDLGAMMLVERFGQPVSVGENRNVTRVAHTSKNSSGAFSSSEASGISRQDAFAAMEGVAQGAWFGLGAIQNLMQIDEHVYTAMGTLAGEQLDTIGDLSKHLSSWESAELGEALPEAAVAKLMGHLAEPIVAQNLRDLGIQVEMPDLSNQEGYDLVLNGEYFINVKTVADSSSLENHFASYPKIPVIVPEDMAGIPEDAIYLGVAESIEKLEGAVNLGSENIVLVDNALSNAGALERAESAGDALLGNVDTVGIPLITLLLSGFREIRLLAANKTDLRNAAKNLSLDLVGTGGGGIVGFSIGASVGTAILPGVGTVVVGLGGAVVMAIASRKGTNYIKERRLKKACKKYDKKCQEVGEKIRSLQEDARHRYKSSVQVLKNDLARSAGDIKNELKAGCDRLIDRRRNICRVENEIALELLDSALTELEDERQRILAFAIPKWKFKMIYGRSLRKPLQERIEYLEKLSRRLESEARKIIKANSGQELIGDQALQFLQLLLCADTKTSSIRSKVKSFEEHRKNLETAFLKLVREKRSKLAEKRFQSMQKLSEKIQYLQEETENKMSAIRQELEPLLQKVRRESDRLGKKMRPAAD
ncbi:MAG: hypothetical protein OXD43_15530 [Bacteroidetes bacterium]|nr:hypothetical protein [Bacteroidota bacterium]